MAMFLYTSHHSSKEFPEDFFGYVFATPMPAQRETKTLPRHDQHIQKTSPAIGSGRSLRPPVAAGQKRRMKEATDCPPQRSQLLLIVVLPVGSMIVPFCGLYLGS